MFCRHYIQLDEEQIQIAQNNFRFWKNAFQPVCMRHVPSSV